MPAYNFQKQFVPKILDKSKRHTIRHERKRPTKVGDVLMLYTGMRTKQCKLIAISECVKVEPIEICLNQMVILGNDRRWIGDVEIKRLALRDGFENVDQFFEFFESHYQLPTVGFELIWWSTDLLLSPHSGNGSTMRVQLGGDHPHPALSLKGEEKAVLNEI